MSSCGATNANGELLDDPNAPVVLCDGCGKDHDAYWDERWEEYYRGLL